MNSRTDPEFWSGYRHLPEQVRRSARQAYARFQDDPFHPSLHLKALRGHDGLWSARITRDYRAVAYREGDTIIWFWIGSHAEFDRTF